MDSWLVELFRELGCQDVDFFYGGRLGEKIGGFGHQCGGDCAVEVCVAARFVGESVKDAESAGAKAESEPCGGGGFLIDEGEAAFEEFLDFVFFSGLGFESNE